MGNAMTGAGKDISEEQRLRGAASWQFRPPPTERRLGEEIATYLEQHNRSLAKNASILEIWPLVVPDFLQDQCRPGKRAGNTLYVEVTPGAYLHQMQMLAGEIVEKIQQLSPRCGIRKIRLVPKIF